MSVANPTIPINQPITFNCVTVRWPSWLWRQVKVILTHIPGHESGVGSSPTLISIRLASVRYPRFFFCQYIGLEQALGLCRTHCLLFLLTITNSFAYFNLNEFLANLQLQIQPADVVVTSIADKVSNGEIWVLEGSLA